MSGGTLLGGNGMADTALESLERKIGYVFSDARLLGLALTHSSFANETDDGGRHNERLEFLGDAVLSLCVSVELFARFPGTQEGDLTRLRSALVNAASLADMAREIGLDEYLRLGRGEENQGGRRRAGLLGDAFEAILGAVYEDGGFAAAQGFVRRFFENRWPRTPSGEHRKDFKTRLQEVVQQKYQDRPEYALFASHGPEHAKVFEIRLLLPDGRSFTARGSSRKSAEQEAARNALLFMDALP